MLCHMVVVLPNDRYYNINNYAYLVLVAIEKFIVEDS